MATTMQLAAAAASGDISSVRQLLVQGADVNGLSSDGMSPLAVAAFWGYADIVEELLKAGADVNLLNRGTLWTPLHCASFQAHGKVILKLMPYEPDLYTTDNQGRTAIDFASALDSIWPFFAAAGCKRTPKSDLIRMDVIKKVSPVDSGFPATDHIRFKSSRPGSAYVMNTQSLANTHYTDGRMAYASVTGDVLAGTPDDAFRDRRIKGSVWNN
ncbi:ankyrin repeat domain-containing protein 49-like [Haliotis cracherodii]|uniref:ankyrin repeat domain-containing protein 49-like n=1 Tax=Haliotis cracherodii TaxID=6455 RepID=UPI001EB04BEA